MSKRYKVRIVSKRNSIDHDYYTGNKEVRPCVWDEPDIRKVIMDMMQSDSMEGKMQYTDFTDDEEKMRDFFALTKEEFLASYSYLTEEEYDLTKEAVDEYRR